LNGQNFHKKLKTNKTFTGLGYVSDTVFLGGHSVAQLFIFVLCFYLFCVLCPMLAMSQNSPFLIAPLIFSDVYLRARSGDIKN